MNLMGFVLVDKISDGMVIQEMFVLNNHKNKSIGSKAVKILFDMYKDN